jgi:hypothetical protein
MKRLTDFGDDVSHYHLVFDVETNRWTTVPNALKWVSVGCEVVDGDTVSYMPLPPQGQFRPTNFVDYNITDPDFSIDTVLNSPTIMMNRITLAAMNLQVMLVVTNYVLSQLICVKEKFCSFSFNPKSKKTKGLATWLG